MVYIKMKKIIVVFTNKILFIFRFCTTHITLMNNRVIPVCLYYQNIAIKIIKNCKKLFRILQTKHFPLLPSNGNVKSTWYVRDECMYTIVHKSSESVGTSRKKKKLTKFHVQNCAQGISRG